MTNYLTLEQMAQRRKLLNALRSKEYIQAQDAICAYDYYAQAYCYCVQGVALDILPYGTWRTKSSGKKIFVADSIPRVYEMLPDDYYMYGEVPACDEEDNEEYGPTLSNSPLSKAMELNDLMSCDFSFIADYLEDQWFPQDGA